MNFKEDFEKVLNHITPDRTPSYFSSVHNAGFGRMPGPSFDRGPLGGGYDGFGVRWVSPSSGAGAQIPAPGEFILKDVTKWKDVSFPDLELFDWESCVAMEMKDVNRDELVVDFGSGNGVFERLATLMGFEEALLAMAEEPEACNDFYTALTDFKIKVAEKVHKYYNPLCFTYYDDIATERGLFMSPDTFRSLIKPHHKRLCQTVINLGMKPIYHCCGKAEVIVEDMIDCGYEAWTSVQPTNDISSILEKYSDKLAILGGYNTNGRPGMADASDEEVRAEVRRCFKEYGKYKVYVFFGVKLANTLNIDEWVAALMPMIDESVKCSIESGTKA